MCGGACIVTVFTQPYVKKWVRGVGQRVGRWWYLPSGVYVPYRIRERVSVRVKSCSSFLIK